MARRGMEPLINHFPGVLLYSAGLPYLLRAAFTLLGETLSPGLVVHEVGPGDEGRLRCGNPDG